MKTTNAFCLALVILAGCSGTARQGQGLGSVWVDGKTWSDREIGLDGSGVFEITSPDPVVYDISQPGEQPNQARPYDLSPPVIPHTTQDYDPITADENVCMECHNGDAAKAVPKSHHVNYRQDPTTAGPEIDGARYNCTACHVPRTNARPLVRSQFRSGSNGH